MLKRVVLHIVEMYAEQDCIKFYRVFIEIKTWKTVQIFIARDTCRTIKMYDLLIDIIQQVNCNTYSKQLHNLFES